MANYDRAITHSLDTTSTGVDNYDYERSGVSPLCYIFHLGSGFSNNKKVTDNCDVAHGGFVELTRLDNTFVLTLDPERVDNLNYIGGLNCLSYEPAFCGLKIEYGALSVILPLENTHGETFDTVRSTLSNFNGDLYTWGAQRAQTATVTVDAYVTTALKTDFIALILASLGDLVTVSSSFTGASSVQALLTNTTYEFKRKKAGHVEPIYSVTFSFVRVL